MFKRTPIKLLSLLLALCLLLTSLPASAVEANAVNAEAADGSTFQLDADCQILDYVHEDVFNQNDHVSRLKDEETLDTYVFLNSDGTKTVYYMNDAVKYRDASGTIREKNIDLTTGINGYSTTQNDVQLHIPNNISNGVQLSYAGYDVSIVPQGGSSRLSPQRNGNSVAYPNYFGSGTALVYTPTLDGVKEDILLAKYNGTSDFTFLLNTDGLNLYHTPEDRYYLALTEEAEMKIWLGNIEIFDAEAKPSMGTLAVETVTAGQQYRLTVSADVDFLTDPDTVYPVTIDPTITVWDNTYGANAIEDAPIFEGYPTSNFGTYQYDRAGYVGSPYGKGRTVVRLNGLVNDTNYAAVSAEDIQNVKFYIADASGTSSTTVYLHELVNVYWTESDATWNSIGSYGNYRSGASVGNNGYASFDITSLAKAWKGEGYNDGYFGFILVGAYESSIDRALYSSEHSTSNMRPYVTATYTYSSSMPTSIDVDIGYSKQLTATGMSGTITWTSSDPTVATVNSAGFVTGTGIGEATITASAPNYTPKTCTVYVTIADGVYYIKNVSSGKYLTADGGGISDQTAVTQETKSTADPDRLSQLWKIKYLDEGYYSIRPMHKLDMGLHYTYNSVNITSIGTVDSLLGVTSNNRWKIAYESNGCVFTNSGYQSRALYPLGGSSSAGTSIVGRTYSSSNSAFRWDIEKVSNVRGVALYETDESKLSTGIVQRLDLGMTKTLTDLCLSVSVYPTFDYNQSVTWSTSNSSVVSVNPSTGAITANGTGTATITATSNSFSENPAHYTVFVPNRSFYYDNIYDASFARNTSHVSLIQKAVECADIAYYNAFSVGFAASQAPVYGQDLLADSCPRGHDSPCSSDCSEDHKEIYAIANDLKEKYPRDRHHITVLWSNRAQGVYTSCIPGDDPSMALAVVLGHQDVIHIMSLTGSTDEELEACMAILLMHETAHTMGLEEQYEYPGHDKNGWVCVMERFEGMANMNMDSNTDNEEGRDLLQFYHDIKNGTIDAFCDSCKTQLSEYVDASYTSALD